MSINLEYYRVFIEVADKLSFSAAASSLYITQPAVSRTITALEKSLGVILFTRTPKGVVLTNEGRHMYHYVGSALNLITSGEKKLEDIMKLEYGEVTIAAADTISKHYLLPYLEEFNTKFPNIKIKVINRVSSECISLVKSAFADLAFINLPEKNILGVKTVKCMEIHDIFVAGEKYIKLKDKKITPEELKTYPIVLLESISNSRKYIEDYFLKKGIKIQPEIELGSHDLLLEFSKIGLGISCVIKEFCEDYLKSNDLFQLNLSPPIKSRYIGLIYSQKIPPSYAATEFLAYFI